VLLVDAALRRAPVQHREPLLALAAADDLADPRRQHVHRHDRPAVVVEAHVLRLRVDARLTRNSNFSFARSSTWIQNAARWRLGFEFSP
jgi:hypothetical protein